MKYTKSALGLLNAQYRSVLKKCLLINLGLFAMVAVTATPAMAENGVTITIANGSTTPTITGENTSGSDIVYNMTTIQSGAAAGATALQATDFGTTLATYAATAVTDGGTGYVTSDLLYDQGYQTEANVKTLISSGAGDGLTSTADSGVVSVQAASGGGISVGSGGISVDTSVFTVKSAGNGLENTSGSVAVKAVDGGGISVGTGGVSVDTSVFTVKSAGNGLENTSGSVAVKAADGTIVVDGSGVKVGTIATSNVSGLDAALNNISVSTNATTGVVTVKDDAGTSANVYNTDTVYTKTETATYVTDNAASASYVATSTSYAANTIGKAIQDNTEAINDIKDGYAFTGSISSTGDITTATGTVSGATVQGTTVKVGGASGISLTKDGSTNTLLTGGAALNTGAGDITSTGTISGATVSGTTVQGTTVKVGGASGISLTKDGSTNTLLTGGAGINTGDGSVTAKVVTVGGTGGVSLSKTDSGDLRISSNLDTNGKNINMGDGHITAVNGNITTTNGTITATNGSVIGSHLKASTDLKIGDSNVITASGSVLNMGTNSLSNIKDFASTALTTDTGAKSVSIGGAGYTTTVTGDEEVTGTLKVGSANAISSTIANTLNMGANALNNTAGLTVGTAGNETFTLGADGSLKIGTKLTDSTNKVENFTVAASDGAMTAAGGKFQVDGSGIIQDVRGINISDGDGSHKKVGLSVVNGSATASTLQIDSATLIKGTLGAGSTGAEFTVDGDGNTVAKGTLTADGESKFGKGTGTTYALDVTSTAVDSNVVLNANSGVKFGDGTTTDAIAMTSVERGAVAAKETTGDNAKVASAQAVQATRSAIQDDVHTVLGDIYTIDSTNKTISYTASALTSGMYAASSASSNLTTSLNNMATNVSAATGTTYGTDGTFSNNYAASTAVGYDIVATDNLAKAIGAVNTNVGDVSNFGSVTDGNTTADTTVVAAVNAVDTALVNTQTALGGMINKTGDVYVNTALTDTTPNGFVASTTTATLTDQLKNYAGNVNTALGGAFDTDGSWETTVDNDNGSANYAYSATSNVMAAMNQVASSIGVADELKAKDKNGNTVDGVNGLTKANTVNQNLTALNNTVGDITGLSAGTGSTGNAITNGTGTAATTVVEALNNIDATLGQIHGLKMGNSHLQANSNLAAGTTVEEHLVSLDDAIGNRNYSSTRYVTAGSDLSTAVGTLDQNLNRVEHKVNNLRHDFEAGMASMAAMTALVPNPRASGDTSLSIGTGAYEGHTAMAIGGFHYITDNIMLNAGAAWGNTNDVAYRLGVTWSW